ncbi:MAG TPA: carcinine hydrolase/isopenicillin-N N-acyltransferase family protein [Chitinophagales bacterium]|nr:carcinine hydrolase/isopenicillin-N N-acyltransferase family protein [Chitinophagales bacterium]
MCDTFVCPPHLSESGNWIFGKNSDREPNEIQLTHHYPARQIPSGMQQCTFIEVQHTLQTFATILSQPIGMWGAEMGVNEKGVTIGNEAVFSKFSLPKKDKGLTGMDMLRLALESCDTAQKAVNKLIQLNENYGQDANGGYQSKFYYHNSFLIADAEEAFVLETAGELWALEKVKTYRAISNGLSITNQYDDIHPKAIQFAINKSWIKKDEEFNFSKAFSAYWMPKLANCQLRKNLVESHQKVKFTISDAFKTLRSHDIEEEFLPQNGSTASVCMHASGLFCPQQTTASMVVEIRRNQASTIWLTGAPSPCMSIFTPFYFDSSDIISQYYKEDAHWKSWSQWQRKAMHDYSAASSQLENLRNEKELSWVKRDQQAIKQNDIQLLHSLSEEALQKSDRTIKALSDITYSKKSSLLFRLFWKKQALTFQ